MTRKNVSIQSPKMTANLLGYAAILLWSFSAMFISWTPGVPPFLLAGLTSLTGFAMFALTWLRYPEKFRRVLSQPWQIWVLFFIAVVVYRGLYLSGLKLAPIVEANLLNYLWPLFIVIFGAAMDRKKIAWQVHMGALACFAGVVLIGLHKADGNLAWKLEIGHLLAICGAIAWAVYSVLTRRFPAAPIDIIGCMHLAAAIIFITLHRQFEQAIDWTALDAWHWFGIIGLGLAISLGYGWWDKAMTEGDREQVAVAAYYTPLLSTLWLVLFGGSVMTGYVWAAAILILGGSLLARFAKIQD